MYHPGLFTAQALKGAVFHFVRYALKALNYCIIESPVIRVLRRLLPLGERVFNAQLARF